MQGLTCIGFPTRAGECLNSIFATAGFLRHSTCIVVLVYSGSILLGVRYLLFLFSCLLDSYEITDGDDIFDALSYGSGAEEHGYSIEIPFKDS